MRCIKTFISLFLICSFYSTCLLSGQISVINPAAGSEITGIVNVSPQPSGNQSSSSSLGSGDLNFIQQAEQMSLTYKKYKEFFDDNNFENFTEVQIVNIKSELLAIIESDNLDIRIIGLLKEQLNLAQHGLDQGLFVNSN